MIAIIDYGVGNLASVLNAFKKIGISAFITSNKEEILNASKVVLPGVGAFNDAFTTLDSLGFVEVINSLVKKHTPILGICVGMQMLFEGSFEFGYHKGLGLVKGNCEKIESSSLKIPHMGWNNITIKKDSKLLKDINDNAYVYFVHSYRVTNLDNAIATSFYDREFCAVVEKDNVYGCQFHPEKSGDIGLEILKNFGEL